MTDERPDTLGLDNNAPEALGEALGHALGILAGYASMCWSDDGSGQFESERASAAVDETANWLLERMTAASVRTLFDDAQLDVFDDVRKAILDNEAATGTWTTKAEARQTGCSLHIKYQKRTDVLGGSSMFIKILEDSPGKLFWIMDKLLTAVGRPLPDDV